ncbi:hypothetical protein P3T76_004522 [Phytophthora citrophthora]|uniref:Uncharacterized protein n=1 Tax=Phytophthora citrophthora TaxID=4793 RepID=A0AAD9GU24_9STRA|nr:hypothetical protein P3T76_004522 [Phytophthora citrophthora]
MIRFVLLLFVAVLPWLLLCETPSEWKSLSWWKGRQLAISLDTWPEPDIDTDECMTRYRDAKHNEICVISR